MKWDDYFMEMAHLCASKSKDRSTKVGCVVVGPNHEVRTTGYNGFCRGVDDDVDSRHERPEKYFWAEHAERNALYNAARNGIRTEDCTVYVTSFPCADCARGLIQSGIKRVVTPKIRENTRIPKESYERAKEMMAEVGLAVDIYGAESAV